MQIQENQFQYFVLNKPRDMVSQFVSPHPVRLLGDLPFSFPDGTHAIGRLDGDSEGILLLTNDKRVTRLLFSGPVPHLRTYLVQINQTLSPENLHALRTGVEIPVDGGKIYKTPPCEVEIITQPEALYTAVQEAQNVGPHTWLTLTLYEGKYRQVRKMIKAVRHRVKRLIRIRIEDILLADMKPGELRELTGEEFFKKLHIKP